MRETGLSRRCDPCRPLRAASWAASAGYRRAVGPRAGRVRRPVAVLAAGVGVLLGGAALVGCGPGDTSPGPAMTSVTAATTAPSAAPEPVPAPTEDAPGSGKVRDAGVPLVDPAATGEAAGALLPAEGASLQVDEGADGSWRVTVAGAAGTLAWFAPPRGGRVEVQQDGSVALLDGAGTVVAALASVVGADGTWGSWRPVGDVLALDGAAGSATFDVGTTAVVSATWGEADGGRSLLVVPADWVRGGSLAAQHALASQLAAGWPDAASASMQAQLWCHVLGAPDKRSWNLEPWRPEVGTAAMLATRCNPEP